MNSYSLSREAMRRAPWFPALLSLLLVLPAGSPDDPHSAFKSWFKKYKKGEIDLYQSSPVPLHQPDTGTFRYFKTEAVQEMDALLAGLAGQNNLKATQCLAEAATFHFDRNPEREKKNNIRNQPWILRAHALEALQKITDQESLEWLQSRCLQRDPSWDASIRRVIAATVLGASLTQEDPVLLRSLLNDRDHEVRERALEGLARLGGAGDLDSVTTLLEDPEPTVRVAAIEAISGILHRLGGGLPPETKEYLAAVTQYLGDDAWPVQEAALTLMERFRAKRSIPTLIGLLERMSLSPEKYRERIVQRTGEVLRSLTEVQIAGTEPEKWKAWWSENRDTFELASAPSPALKGFQLDVPYFFNIPVNSDFLYFILDTSGSMRSPLDADGEDVGANRVTKLIRAREELGRTLEGLDPDVRFNIVLFNDQVHQFAKEPVQATEASTREAIHFFEGTEAEGGTNLFDALNMALQIQSMGLVDRFGENLQFDTIFLLSDGVPTKGIVIDPNEILRIITKANQYSKIKINTIYLGTEPNPFMRDLAEKNFGRFIHIR